MIARVSKPEEITEIINYLGENYKATPYLYANVIKFGLGTDKVFTWIDRTEINQIAGVYLLYYDCLHFYTNEIDSYPIQKLLEFIQTHDHKVIMLQGKVGDRVDAYLSEDYYSERNHVIDMDKVGLEEQEFRSEISTREDIEQIADLLLADAEYTNVYNRQVLLEQMYDRYDNQFSRYFVVKMDNKIVASCHTYGEVPGFAMVGAVIVHPDYRRRGLASDVENFACHVLENDKISRVGFINFNNTASLALHEKLGAYSFATLAKFVKK